MRGSRALLLLLAVAGLAAGGLAGAGGSAGAQRVCPQPLPATASAAALTPTVPCSPCPPVHVVDAEALVCTTPCSTDVCTPTVPTVPAPVARTCVTVAAPHVRSGVFDITCHGPSGMRFRAWAKVRKRTLGRGHRTTRASGRAVVRVRLLRAGRHALAGAAHGLHVRVIAHDPTGASVLNRVVRLRH